MMEITDPKAVRTLALALEFSYPLPLFMLLENQAQACKRFDPWPFIALRDRVVAAIDYRHNEAEARRALQLLRMGFWPEDRLGFLLTPHFELYVPQPSSMRDLSPTQLLCMNDVVMSVGNRLRTDTEAREIIIGIADELLTLQRVDAKK